MSRLPESELRSGAWPAWPERLIEHARALGQGDEPRRDAAASPQLWLLMNSVLRQSIRTQSRRLGPVQPEDVEDLASEKSLELLNQLDGKKWTPAGSSPAEVVRFLTSVARNALVDHLRRTGSRPMARVEDIDEATEGWLMVDAPDKSPGVRVERRGFVEALGACAQRLESKHRTIWLFRVFYELPTKKIASHPEVDLDPGHVDVILQRCRGSIRDCMKAKGYSLKHVPPGTFAEMWETFRLDQLPCPNESANA